MRTRPITVLTATLALATIASPAFAHTTANPSTTAAGAFAIVDMRVPHGCDGESTAVLQVSIPSGVVSVKPEDVPGWAVETEIGVYDEPVSLHGEDITEGVVAVTWTAEEGEELADAAYRDFGLSVKLPETVGETLYFPAVQSCVDGSETAWIEIPAEEGEELEHPAPAITLTPAAGDGHGDATDEGDAADETDGAEPEESSAEDADGAVALDPVEAASVDAGDDGTDPIVWLALGVAVLGLAVGAAGLTAARRR